MDEWKEISNKWQRIRIFRLPQGEYRSVYGNVFCGNVQWDIYRKEGPQIIIWILNSDHIKINNELVHCKK